MIEEKSQKWANCHEVYVSNLSKNILRIYIYIENLDIQGQMSSFTNPALSLLPQLEYIIAQRRKWSSSGFHRLDLWCIKDLQLSLTSLASTVTVTQQDMRMIKTWKALELEIHTKCNSLLPVWGAPILPEEYRKHLDKCFSYIGSKIGATEIMRSGVALIRMRFKILVHDIHCLFLPFASLEESFSFIRREEDLSIICTFFQIWFRPPT